MKKVPRSVTTEAKFGWGEGDLVLLALILRNMNHFLRKETVSFGEYAANVDQILEKQRSSASMSQELVALQAASMRCH